LFRRAEWEGGPVRRRAESGDRPEDRTSRLSREEPHMKNVLGLVAFLLSSAYLSAAEVKGKVIDPSGAAIGGRESAVTNRVGVVSRTRSDSGGGFAIEAPDGPDSQLVVTAPGFATRTLLAVEATSVTLELAPRVDSISVTGSTIELPAAAQASST